MRASELGTLIKKSLAMLDSGRGWEPEIMRHYNSCKEYGFLQIHM